jgi:putative FmdB family regulatory protein
MPTYEYVCESCGDYFEGFLSIEDRDFPTILACTKCNNHTIVRSIGNSGGFRLKGSCWARDGYSTNVGDDTRYKSGKINIGEN